MWDPHVGAKIVEIVNPGEILLASHRNRLRMGEMSQFHCFPKIPCSEARVAVAAQCVLTALLRELRRLVLRAINIVGWCFFPVWKILDQRLKALLV
jgi:hypothetical protein